MKFLYEPAEFLKWRSAMGGKLESFLVIQIQKLLQIVLDDGWRPIIDKMALQIRVVSEGWAVPPRLLFEFSTTDGFYVSRLVQIKE